MITIESIRRLQRKWKAGDISARVQRALLNGYEGYLSSGRLNEDLQAFMFYLVEQEKNSVTVPYNLLIQCEEDYQTREFIEHLCDSISQLGLTNNSHVIFTEKELLENPEGIREKLMSGRMAFIHSWSEAASDYEDKIMDEFENTPEVIKVVIAPKAVINERFKPREHLYYRVFSSHLYVMPYESSDILTAFLTKLSSRQSETGMKISQEFEEEIAKYIDMVYPKASLRGKPFVDDLFNRVIRIALEKGNSDILDADCIPYYIKPEEEKTVESEIYNSFVCRKEMEKMVEHTRIHVQYKKHGLSNNSPLNIFLTGSSSHDKKALMKLYGRLLFSAGIIKSPRFEEISGKILSENNNTDILEDLILQKKNGLICITEADALLGNKELQKGILALVKKEADSFVWILESGNKKIYSFEEDCFQVFSYIVSLDSFSMEEQMAFIKKYASARGAEIGESVRGYFDDYQQSNDLSVKEIKDIIDQGIKNHIIKTKGNDEHIVLEREDFEYKSANTDGDNVPAENIKETSAEQKNDDALEQSAVEKKVSSLREALVPEKVMVYDTYPGIRNVLLLSLSTFKSTMDETKYSFKQRPISGTVKGYYQLEPVPKMLKTYLETKNETLDSIIIMETKKALEKADVTIGKTGYSGRHSAAEIFKTAIRPYMNPSVPEHKRFFEVLIEADSNEEGMSDSDKRVEAIGKIFSYLKGLDTPNLYIDTHGGLRENSLVSQAIMSLLDKSDAVIKNVYSVKYNGDECSEIVDVSDEFYIFKFVSGMNELRHSGRFDTMEEFFNIIGLNKKTEEKKLITQVQKTVTGIQMCSVNHFRNGYKGIREYFLKHDNVQNRNTYLSIFNDSIKKDYAGLLAENPSVVDEIWWCRKKGFYQQALTLIESCMPEYYKQKGLLAVMNFEVIKKENDELSQSNKKRIKDKQFLPLFNKAYFFQDSEAGINKGYGMLGDVRKKLSQCQVLPLSGYEENEELKKRSSEGEKLIQPVLVSLKDVPNVKEVKANFCFVLRKRNPSYIDMLLSLLELHCALKLVRNVSNHADQSKDYYSKDKIDWAIDAYLYFCQELGIYHGPEKFTLDTTK